MIESILSKLSEVSERFIEIENLLSQPDITSNQENYIKLSKEYSDLSPIVKAFKDYKKNEYSLSEARQLVEDGDPEIREMAEIEIEDYRNYTNNNSSKPNIFLAKEKTLGGRDFSTTNFNFFVLSLFIIISMILTGTVLRKKN